MFAEVFEKMNKKCAKNNPEHESDYVKDELVYCGKCNAPKQCRITVAKRELVMYCDCKCMEEQYIREQNLLHEHEKSLAVNNLRNSCIPHYMHNWTFENDNGTSKKLMNVARRYVNGWEDMKAKNIGLCFFGDVGTGKTYATICIANALINRRIKVVFTNFSHIINAMQSFEPKDKNAYINNICNCELLIIDDLGAERQSDYALEICEQVIDGRVKAGKPLILTTNIPLESLKNPHDMKYARMYSRILQLTVPVHSAGADKRKSTHEDNMKWAKEYFMGAGE